MTLSILDMLDIWGLYWRVLRRQSRVSISFFLLSIAFCWCCEGGKSHNKGVGMRF